MLFKSLSLKQFVLILILFCLHSLLLLFHLTLCKANSFKTKHDIHVCTGICLKIQKSQHTISKKGKT